MKHKLLFFLVFTLSLCAYGIDFNKVTGTFDVEEKKLLHEENSQITYGTFSGSLSKFRSPASVDNGSREESTSVTELTGTFEE